VLLPPPHTEGCIGDDGMHACIVLEAVGWSWEKKGLVGGKEKEAKTLSEAAHGAVLLLERKMSLAECTAPR
jgi:hypothetical protein